MGARWQPVRLAAVLWVSIWCAPALAQVDIGVVDSIAGGQGWAERVAEGRIELEEEGLVFAGDLLEVTGDGSEMDVDIYDSGMFTVTSGATQIVVEEGVFTALIDPGGVVRWEGAGDCAFHTVEATFTCEGTTLEVLSEQGSSRVFVYEGMVIAASSNTSIPGTREVGPGEWLRVTANQPLGTPERFLVDALEFQSGAELCLYSDCTGVNDVRIPLQPDFTRGTLLPPPLNPPPGLNPPGGR